MDPESVLFQHLHEYLGETSKFRGFISFSDLISENGPGSKCKPEAKWSHEPC